MGVMGGLGGAWERGARRRHRRRLEILKAKSELKSAQASPPATALVAPSDAGADEPPAVTQTERVQRLLDTHDAVVRRWLDYELDVAKLIAFPAMSDGRQPLTAAFLRAKKVADGLRPASPKARLSREEIAEYADAVTDFEVAFDVAERDARRVKDSSFTEGERKRLDTAKQLLSVAIDQAATPAERQIAYRRVRDELDGLISLSDEAIEVLEEKVALELTTGTLPTAPLAPAQSAPATSSPTQPANSVQPSPVQPGPVQPASPPKPPPPTNTSPGRIIRPHPH